MATNLFNAGIGSAILMAGIVVSLSLPTQAVS